MSFHHVVKGRQIFDFLFTCMGDEALPKRDLHLEKRTCSKRNMLIPFRVDRLRRVAKMKMAELLLLKVQR